MTSAHLAGVVQASGVASTYHILGHRSVGQLLWQTLAVGPQSHVSPLHLIGVFRVNWRREWQRDQFLARLPGEAVTLKE